ncbi:tetratricopeptide repeat protein [bacterium]|nr:tetratricopeptide repeat protein [bacterium]
MDNESREMNLRYTFNTIDDVVVISLTGDLDMYTVPRAKEMLQIVISQGKFKVLVNLNKNLTERGGVLKLSSPGAYTQRVFDLIHLDYFIEIFQDDVSSLESFKSALSKSVQQWYKVTRMNPDYADAHHKLAIALREQGNLQEALEEEKKALAINPEYVEGHKGLGDIYRMQGKFEDAVNSYQKALTINPKYADALSRLGEVYNDQTLLEQAISLFQQALEITPNYADIHNNLGNAFHLCGKVEEAKKEYEIALRINPHYVKARLNLANLLKKLGDTEGWEREMKAAQTSALDERQRESIAKTLLDSGANSLIP